MDKVLGCLGIMLAGVVVIAGIAFLMAFPTMWLWNAIMPDITKEAVTALTFWQALGLNFLCGILFKNSSVSANKSE